MDMTELKSIMCSQGKADARDLADRASGLDGTAIIAEEEKVPLFVWGTDYSGCPVGAPVSYPVDEELQIFTMLTPVNTANYPGINPNDNRDLYSLCHTTDPAKAKPWVPSQGVSGLYRLDECCTYNGHVWRNLFGDNPYPPQTVTVEHYWEDLGEVGAWGV